MGLFQLFLGKEKKVRLNPFVIPVKNYVSDVKNIIEKLSVSSPNFLEDVESHLKKLYTYLRNYKMSQVTNLGQVNQSIVVRKINYWLQNNSVLLDLIEEYKAHTPEQKKIIKLKKNIKSDLESFIENLERCYHSEEK